MPRTPVSIAVLLASLVLVPISIAGAPAAEAGPLASGMSFGAPIQRARDSVAFDEIRDLRQVLKTLEDGQGTAADVAEARRLLSEIRRKDPSFDASRLENRLEDAARGVGADTRSATDAPAPVRDTAPAPSRSASISFPDDVVGEIVFFTADTSYGSESATNVSDTFRAGDPIYAISYLEKNLEQYAHVPNRDYIAKSFRYDLFIDGERIQTFNGFPAYLTWEEYKDPSKRFVELDMMPDPGAVSYTRPSQYNNPLEFLKEFGKLSPGRHTVELKLIAEYDPIATGTFIYDNSGGNAPLDALATSLKQRKDSAVSLPAPKMRNAALEQSMVQALKSNGWRQTIKRVVITSSDWRIHRNAFGGIAFRSLNTTVGLQEPDGRCRLFEISFKQEYQGGGRYGRTEQYGVGNNIDIACDKLGGR